MYLDKILTTDETILIKLIDDNYLVKWTFKQLLDSRSKHNECFYQINLNDTYLTMMEVLSSKHFKYLVLVFKNHIKFTKLNMCNKQ